MKLVGEREYFQKTYENYKNSKNCGQFISFKGIIVSNFYIQKWGLNLCPTFGDQPLLMFSSAQTRVCFTLITLHKHKQIQCFYQKPIPLENKNKRVYFGKNIEKKHLFRHDKNHYYFRKSNIPVINLIVDSRNMIKVSKNMSL